MAHKRKRFPYNIPKHWITYTNKTLKIAAFIGLLIISSTVIESIGQSFDPKITVDAYNAKGTIDPEVFGYSLSSEFQYDPKIVNAIKQNPVESIRLTAPKDAGKRFIAKVNNGVYNILASDNVPYTYGKEYDVEIVVDGNNIRTYIDGSKIFDVRDSELKNGEIGLFSSKNQEVAFDDVEIFSRAEEPLFSDSFNGNASNQWNQNGYPSWFDNGSWFVADGKYKHIGQQSIAIKKVGNPDWKNYIIKAKITPLSSNELEQGFIGLVFRHQNPLTSYRFLWQGPKPQPYSGNNPFQVSDFNGQIETARNANTKPHAVVNLRGTPEDGARLVRNLNQERGLNIEYFELGNEIWAFGDNHMPSETYAEQIKQYSQKMKAVDPSIKVGASLLIGFSDWDVKVIENAAQYIDFVTLHYYPPTKNGAHISDLQLLASSYSFGHAYRSSFGTGNKGFIEETKNVLRRYAPNEADRIEIIVSEFNTHDETRGKQLNFGLATSEMIAAAADQNSKKVQFHALGASNSHWHSFTERYTPRPAALALSLFSENYGSISLPVSHRDIPTYHVNELDSLPKLNNVPYLTTFASRNNTDDKLYIAAINKHSLATMNTQINIDHANIKRNAKVYTLEGQSEKSTNENGQNVRINESNFGNASNKFTYPFKPHSVTILELDISLKNPDQTTTTEIKDDPTSPLEPDNTDFTNTTTQEKGPTKIVVGARKGGNPHAKTFDKNGIPTGLSFLSFNKNFRGGINIAYADVNGDGNKDIITGAGPGGGPHIRVFDHNGKEIFNFFPFHPDFRGGVTVAGGDIDGDGVAEIIAAQQSSGQAWVKAYKANTDKTVVTTFNAYGSVESGADVATGDIDKDGKDEIIVGAGKGGGPLIRVYDENGQVKPIQFFAFHPGYRQGISVAAGDVDGDGKDEVIASQSGPEQAWIKVYRYNNQKTVLGEWKAYGNFEVGAHVATSDLDNDGQAEIITGAGLGGGPQIRAFESYGKALSTNFFAFDQAFKGGIDIAAD